MATPLPIRKRTGTANFHLSAEAVRIGVQYFENMKERDAIRYLTRTVWGSVSVLGCPHCGTIDEHYWTEREMRWKCRACRKYFSITSGTVLSGTKLSLKTILRVAFAWQNGSSGVPALQLRRDFGLSYVTAYTLVQRFREAIVRGHNVGLLAGVQEIDGVRILGRDYKSRRGVPRGAKTPVADLKIPTALTEPDDVANEAGAISKTPADRRVALVLRRRGQHFGRGGRSTRVGVALSESAVSATAFVDRFVSADSVLFTDGDAAYQSAAGNLRAHYTVNHQERFSGPNGETNNLAESFNWRMRRLERGVYLNVSPKYAMDYAAEAAWREDCRRMSNADRMAALMSLVLSVGPSQWFARYKRKGYRDFEFLLEGNRKVSPRAPNKPPKDPR